MPSLAGGAAEPLIAEETNPRHGPESQKSLPVPTKNLSRLFKIEQTFRRKRRSFLLLT
jgi:hypothetical protein